MKEMDCVEVTAEKKAYADNGVHKEIPVMYAVENERIRAQFEN